MATPATTGGPSHAAREARRRRILERGSDRLALITGQIQSLPPDPEPDQSRPSTCSPGQIPAPDLSQHEDAASTEESGKERLQQHAVSDNTVEPPPPRDSQNGDNIQSRSMAVHDIKEESPQISSSSSMQRPAQDHQRSLFTTGKIRSSIAASENIRMSCSVAAALLVIASYMGFPITGFLNTFKPVYLLLLTNITIVLGWVILGAQGMELTTGRRRRAPTADGNALADQLGEALELGLLMHKIFGALFMDFSIYAVVLVFGLSLAQKLGW
ncbi:hypothetical protein C2S52_002795 [Perilla frutescens var. hirtella]|nr:hypothetical protein C2S51_012652 [Perilla frutescens var. frutescens]KAH6792318.1 hypothetical protein C2S52_002795 [Perilla frutescens var. hirtella]